MTDKLVRSKIPGLDGLPVIEYRRLFHAMKRDENRMKFLTHDGKPRKRGFWNRYFDLDALPPDERNRERQRRWFNRKAPKALELAYLALRAEIEPAAKVDTYMERGA